MGVVGASQTPHLPECLVSEKWLQTGPGFGPLGVKSLGTEQTEGREEERETGVKMGEDEGWRERNRVQKR